jgi:NAD(P)-dependent dehydrogenase (short-subunit alcohol dehydrogenase family)
MSLRGREIVLAGGAGGLGSATASLLLAEGARVLISYRSNRERAERAALEIRLPAGQVIQADLASEKDRARLLDEAPELYGLVVLTGDPAEVQTSPPRYRVRSKRISPGRFNSRAKPPNA